ncbi:MAG: sulfatase [Planctomycetes bacterium]|nr:sulfatase [Planctomycetota bacterium]
MGEYPDILFIMADQLRPQSCGYMGDAKAQTPNLDRLAEEGVNFTNAVSMHPVCGPFRASLFTGCHSSTTGYVINELSCRTDLPTLAGAVNGVGYRSEYIGKWHLWATQAKEAYSSPADFHKDEANQFVPPGPARLGFDGHWAAWNFNHDYNRGFYYRDTPQRLALDGYEPDLQTDMAIERLRLAQKDAAPLFLCLSYGTPHQPWNTGNVPAEWLERFTDVPFGLPANYADGHGRYWHECMDEAWWTKEVKPHLGFWQRCYYAMTANLDWNLGRLLSALEQEGLADNTLVVFTSDHGEMFGAHGRAQKNIFWDEAARVPLLMRWPGRIPESGVTDACINTPDLMPTLLGLCGVQIPPTCEGLDLSHCARGRPGPEPQAALLQGMGPSVDWDDGHEWRALRDKRHTYAVDRQGCEHLFDNQADPLQLTNLVSHPAFGAVLKNLRTQLHKHMEQLGDTFESATWYRDHWIEKGQIVRGAKG